VERVFSVLSRRSAGLPLNSVSPATLYDRTAIVFTGIDPLQPAVEVLSRQVIP